jgi:hypothetical protein
VVVEEEEVVVVSVLVEAAAAAECARGIKRRIQIVCEKVRSSTRTSILQYEWKMEDGR